MQDAKEFAKKITIKKNLVSADLNAEPKYYLTHNKHCTEFRQRAMKDASEFDRGYLFGTACICNGAEDRILDKIEVKITRIYREDAITVTTEQAGICLDGDALVRVQKQYRDSSKVLTVKQAQFGEEIATEIEQGTY